MSKALNNKKLIKIVMVVVFIILYIAEIPFDRYIPGVEGVSLGLNNAIIVAAIFTANVPFAVILLVIKMILSLLFTSSAMFTAIASIISFAVMVLAKKYIKDIGVAGVSVLGALTYNISSIVTASILICNNILINNLPLVLVFSIIYGVITGGIACFAQKYIANEQNNGGNNE